MAEAMNRQFEVVQALKQIVEPNLNRDLVSLGMVQHLRVVDDYISLRLYLGSHHHFLEAAI